MKRMLLAAIAAVGLLSAAMANGNGPIVGKVAGGGCSSCGTAAAPLPGLYGTDGCAECERNKRFGLHPLLQRLAFWKKTTECGTCGLKARFGLGCGKDGCGRGGCLGNCAGQGVGFNPYPNGVPGTLVFPNHPYVRSPRDWYEK